MTPIDLDAILPFIEKPSRYLGTETNRIRKTLEKVRLRFVLAFPDLYEIGMSHFGLQILYHILNRRPEIAAERVFTPAPDMAAQLREKTYRCFHSSLGFRWHISILSASAFFMSSIIPMY